MKIIKVVKLRTGAVCTHKQDKKGKIIIIVKSEKQC